MSSRAETRSTAALAERIEAYYTAYYRDALGIPAWREFVQVRLADEAYEGRRLARLEAALGAPVRGCRLLNVGCGTGGFNVVAERAGAEGWAVDADGEAVRIADARLPGRVLEAQAERLPFPDRSFDVVYCFSTLEHVRDARRAVGEMVRVLTDEGRLYLHTPSRAAWFESHYKLVLPPGLPRALARRYLTWRGRPAAFLEGVRLLTDRECRSHLAAAGAVVVRTLAADADRAVGGPLWPCIRFYYRALGVRPYVELVAARSQAR